MLGGVAAALPALIKANRIQEKARNVGFDWEEREQVQDKVREETAEVEAEIRKGDKDGLEAEFGDLMFALVNAARLYGVNPENALERTNRKFIARFNYLESESKRLGKSTKGILPLAEMDAIGTRPRKEVYDTLYHGEAFGRERHRRHIGGDASLRRLL